MLSRRSSRFLSLITGVSIFGLTLGVMALVVVVSVMNGFDSQLKHRILGAVPHVISRDRPEPKVGESSAEFLRFQGMVLAGDSRLVTIFGIDPMAESEISVLPDHMLTGDLSALQAGSNKAVVGSTLAARLGLWSDEQTTLLIPVASDGGSRVIPKIAKVTIAGTFRLDSELDHSLLLMHVEDLKRFTGSDHVTYRITLDNIFSAGTYKADFPESIMSTWYDDYGDFFAAVRMEKLMMFLLLTMIVMIAALNTVSGLSMMVKEKQAEIAVLRTMGLDRHQISLIFVVQGSAIGMLGVLLGLIIGLPIAYHVTEIVSFFENIFGGRMLAGTYFDRVPTDVRLTDIFAIALVSIFIAITATLYPAFRAGRLEPAQVLRAE